MGESLAESKRNRIWAQFDRLDDDIEILEQGSLLSKGEIWTRNSAPLVFFRSLLRDPRAIGALLPSSPRLSRLIASGVDPDSPAVVEVGAGTGPVTRELLRRGIGPERLFVIERDPEFVAYLQEQFPRVSVICGDALDAARILSRKVIGPIKTVVSSLPIRNLSRREQLTTIGAMMKVLAPDGQLIQYSYGSGFPVPTHKLGLNVQRLGRVWMNVPPAEVWRLTRRVS